MNTTAMTYDDLIGKFRAGDRGAAEELIVQLWPEVVGFIAFHAPWPELVEEISQAAFVTALEQIATYEPRGTFPSWVKGIAKNLLRRELARRSRMVSADREAISAYIAQVAAEDLERQALVDEARDGMLERLQRCLESLSPQARRLAERRFVLDLSLNKLAQQFKRTRASIAKALFVIRAQLRSCAERETS